MYAILATIEEFEVLQNYILGMMKELQPNTSVQFWDNISRYADLNKHQSKELYACIIKSEWIEKYEVPENVHIVEYIEELPGDWYENLINESGQNV